jgi:hypothetical protein
MKKSLIILILLIVMVVRPALALDATPSAKAQDLLDRVATKVAELSQKFQKAYLGKIKSLGTTTFVITSTDGDHAISTNDATSFFRIRAGAKSEVNFAALKIGDEVATLGTIDPTTTDLTARQIIAKIQRQVVGGVITDVTKDLFTVKQFNGTEIKLDFADVITLKKFTGDKLVIAKQSDFTVGSSVFAIAYRADDSPTLSVLKAILK